MGYDSLSEFVIRLREEGFTESSETVVDSLEDVAEAADKANSALEGRRPGRDGETTQARMLHGARAARAAYKDLEKALVGFTQIAGREFFGFMQTRATEAFEAWKSHYITVVEWRREFAHAAEDVEDFSTRVIGASAKYGGSLRTVTEVSMLMSRGLKRGSAQVDEIAGKIGQLERLTGASGETVALLRRNIVTLNESMSDAEFEHNIYAIRALTRETGSSAKELLSIMGESRNVFSRFPNDTESLMHGIAVVGTAFDQAGGNARMLESVLQSIGQSGSEASRLFVGSAGKDLKEYLRILGETALGASEWGIEIGTAQEILRGYGFQGESAIRTLIKSVKLVDENKEMLKGALEKPTSRLKEEEFGMMKTTEKILFTLQKSQNMTIGIWDNLMNKTGPIGKGILGAVQLAHDTLERLERLTAGTKYSGKDPTASVAGDEAAKAALLQGLVTAPVGLGARIFGYGEEYDRWVTQSAVGRASSKEKVRRAPEMEAAQMQRRARERSMGIDTRPQGDYFSGSFNRVSALLEELVELTKRGNVIQEEGKKTSERAVREMKSGVGGADKVRAAAMQAAGVG